ncbi:MAG: putative MFS-type transporter YcaD [Chlamydiae bacterium]|nr:putative MFS-type transporter YcaD [Chlamydiota bacterium]
MRHLLRITAAPLFSLAFLMLSNGFFLTYVSAKLLLNGASSLTIGIIQGSYYAGFMIAALKSEHLIQRIKHIRAFSFFASIATACTLATVLANHLIVWILLRFLMGICVAALYVVIESWLLTISSIENRGVILAIYMSALYVAQSASQFIMDMIDLESLMAYIVAAFLASCSVIPVTFTHTRIPDINSPPVRAIFRLFILVPLGTVGAILAGTMLGSFYTFGPNYAQTNHISIAYLMSLTIAGGFLLQYPIGRISDVIGRRKVVIVVSLISFASALAIILTTGHPFWILFFSFILGGFTFTIYPLSIAQVVDRSEPEDLTSVAGVMLFAYSLGAVIGPFVTPIFIYVFKGELGLYYFIALASLLLTLTGFVLSLIRRPFPKKKQENFVALPPQTPVGYDLDPRSEEPTDKP